MKFSQPLLKGTLIQRYKRFIADIKLYNGEYVTAHCPNSGSMMGCKTPGSIVYVTKNPNPKRKLKYTWELISVNNNLVGINTNHPNKLVKEAIENYLPHSKPLPEYSDFLILGTYGFYKGKATSPQGTFMRNCTKKIARMAGITKHVTPYLIRASAITLDFNNNVNPLELSD